MTVRVELGPFFLLQAEKMPGSRNAGRDEYVLHDQIGRGGGGCRTHLSVTLIQIGFASSYVIGRNNFGECVVSDPRGQAVD